MATRTWLMKDLESVANSGCTITLERALLGRIVREAEDRFDAPNGMGLEHGAGNADAADAFVVFSGVRLPWPPKVRLQVIRLDAHRVRVQVGAQPGAAALSYTFDFRLIDETPADLFLGLFACALESAKARKQIG